MQGTSAINASLDIVSGGTLQVQGLAGSIDASLTVANGFTNAGTIVFTDNTVDTNTSTLTVTAGTLTNTGTITSENPLGGSSTRTLVATLDNQGTLNIDRTLTITNTATTFTNSGTIDIASVQFVQVTGGTTVFDTGTTLLGTGTFLLNTGGDLTLNTNTTFSGPSLLMIGAGGTVGGTGTLTVGTLAQFNDTTVNVAYTNQGTTQATDATFTSAVTLSAGTLTTRGVTAIDGALTISGGILQVQGTTSIPTASLTEKQPDPHDRGSPGAQPSLPIASTGHCSSAACASSISPVVRGCR